VSGWWEQQSSSWQACVIAQVGAALGVGAGGFIVQFQSSIPVRPVFLLMAGGFGFGGSVGSAVSIPWRNIIHDALHPANPSSRDDIIWNPIRGTFSCQELNHAPAEIVQIGASAMLVGAQMAMLTAQRGWTDPRYLFRQQISVPRNLRAAGNAVAGAPQLSASMGASAFAFRGIYQYLGS